MEYRAVFQAKTQARQFLLNCHPDLPDHPDHRRVPPILTAPVAMLQSATTAAVWSALGTLTAPASSAPRAESVGLPSPLELRASITTGAHRVLAPLMFVSKLRLGSI